MYAIHTLILKDESLNPQQFSQFDAVVLEAYHPQEWWDKFRESFLYQTHQPLLSLLQQTQKPTYIVDVLTNEQADGIELLAGGGIDLIGAGVALSGIIKCKQSVQARGYVTRREFLTSLTPQALKIVAGGYLASHFLSEEYSEITNRSPRWLARMQSWRTHILPTPRFGFRDAISARKIEEFVVPEVTRAVGREPRILIVAGAGHSGLEDDLQHKYLRDNYIELYSSLGYLGINTEHLNTITNLTVTKDSKLCVTSRSAGLF